MSLIHQAFRVKSFASSIQQLASLPFVFPRTPYQISDWYYRHHHQDPILQSESARGKTKRRTRTIPKSFERDNMHILLSRTRQYINQILQIVSVNGTDVVEAQFFKQRTSGSTNHSSSVFVDFGRSVLNDIWKLLRYAFCYLTQFSQLTICLQTPAIVNFEKDQATQCLEVNNHVDRSIIKSMLATRRRGRIEHRFVPANAPD